MGGDAHRVHPRGDPVFIDLRLWRALAIASAILSLVTIALFWHFSMIIGAAVDGGILFALL